MAIDSAAVSVGTTATVVHTFASEIESIVVYNNGSATIFLGSSADTTSTGFPLAAGASLALKGSVGEVLYGIVASSTVEARVLRQGI